MEMLKDFFRRQLMTPAKYTETLLLDLVLVLVMKIRPNVLTV